MDFHYSDSKTWPVSSNETLLPWEPQQSKTNLESIQPSLIEINEFRSNSERQLKVSLHPLNDYKKTIEAQCLIVFCGVGGGTCLWFAPHSESFVFGTSCLFTQFPRYPDLLRVVRPQIRWTPKQVIPARPFNNKADRRQAPICFMVSRRGLFWNPVTRKY